MVTSAFLLSDVHIGTNVPSNWYQDKVNYPYLQTALAYIAQREQTCPGSIQELVLLGDTVDQWTYLPSARPPSLGDIAGANPDVFGTKGIIAQTVDALQGRVLYVRGNHDMLVQDAELRLYFPNVFDGVFYVPGWGNSQVICTHGHGYSLCNAPWSGSCPPDMPGLPIGYFISRLAAELEIKQSGPIGGDAVFSNDAFGHLVPQLQNAGDQFAKILLGGMSQSTNQSDLTFLLPDGTSVDLETVLGYYQGLYGAYPASAQLPPQYFGPSAENTRIEAFMSTDVANELQPFARVLGPNYKVVVMGHTHVYRDVSLQFWGPGNAASVYVNSGFNCPSAPEMQAGKEPTFVEVQITSTGFSVIVYAVINSAGQLQVKQVAGPVTV